MPTVVPITTHDQRLELRRQRDGRDLRLVTHLHEKNAITVVTNTP